MRQNRTVIFVGCFLAIAHLFLAVALDRQTVLKMLIASAAVWEREKDTNRVYGEFRNHHGSPALI